MTKAFFQNRPKPDCDVQGIDGIDAIPLSSAPMSGDLTPTKVQGSRWGPIGEATPGIGGGVSPPAHTQDDCRKSFLAVAQETILSETSGAIKKAVLEAGAPVVFGDAFDAYNTGADVEAADLLIGGYDEDCRPFFAPAKVEGEVCDCEVDHAPGADEYYQIGDVCSVEHLHCNLDSNLKVYLQLEVDGGGNPQFYAEFYSDAGMTTLIGESALFSAEGDISIGDGGSGSGFGGTLHLDKGTNTGSSVELKETGDSSNQLSNYQNITGFLTKLEENNYQEAEVHIVSDGGGYYHVEIYKNSTLIGHTASYITTGNKAIIEDNGSGLGGTITVDAVVSATTNIRVELIVVGMYETPLNEFSQWEDLTNLFRDQLKVYIKVFCDDDMLLTFYRSIQCADGDKIGRIAGTFTEPGTYSVIPLGSTPCGNLGGTLEILRIYAPFDCPAVAIICAWRCECTSCADCVGEVCGNYYWEIPFTCYDADGNPTQFGSLYFQNNAVYVCKNAWYDHGLIAFGEAVTFVSTSECPGQPIAAYLRTQCNPGCPVPEIYATGFYCGDMFDYGCPPVSIPDAPWMEPYIVLEAIYFHAGTAPASDCPECCAP